MTVKSTEGLTEIIKSGGTVPQGPGNADPGAIAEVIAGLNAEIDAARIQITINKKTDPQYNDTNDRARIGHMQTLLAAHRMVLRGLTE